MSDEQHKDTETKLDLVEEMSFPKYHYQSPRAEAGSVTDTSKKEEPRIFEGLRNLNCAD